MTADPRRGPTIVRAPSSSTPTRRAERRRAERDDDLVTAETLTFHVVAELAGEQAKGGVDLVIREIAEHLVGKPLAQPDLDACAWLKCASRPGTSRSPARTSALIQMRPRSAPRS